jgi:hypothetical protein
MALCYVCWRWAASSEVLCKRCGSVVDLQLPIGSPDDAAALHAECRCDPNCSICEAEDEADISCGEGFCSHDICLEERTAQVERGVV